MNVPILSRCKEHNGHVVVVSDLVVPTHERTSYRTKDRRLALLYSSMIDGMRRLKDGTVGLIFTYPDHFPFMARDLIDPTAWHDFPDKYFPECRRVLQADGHIVLFLENFALASVVYSASKAGFKIVSQSIVRMTIADEPLTSTFLDDFHTYKTCLVLVRKGQDSDKRIGDIKLKNAERHIVNLYSSGLILDTSCIHYPFVLAGRKVARTVGIVSDRKRYNVIKERIKETNKEPSDE